MHHPASIIICQEHSALSAMLRSVLLLLSQHRSTGAPLDCASLRAILFYLDEFPEKRHHLKESQLLFPKLRARTPLARELLDRLDEDHSRGEHRIRELEHLLLGCEMMGESRFAAFEDAASRYVEFYFSHMLLEERELLPLADRVLTDEDWAELDAAFTADQDPLSGGKPDAEYVALFTRIVNLVPAPLGLGPARTS